ncbi:MAG: acyl-CoA dehydrogenase family protein [Azospirillaceae bacterium]
MSYADDAAAMAEALARTPNWARVADELLDRETLTAVLGEAAKLAESAVAPLNQVADRQSARLRDGRVTLPAGFRAAYDALAAGGWLALEQTDALGGQGLPLTLFAATDPLFERACPAFMMAAGGSRAAARLLTTHGDPAIRADWVPALLKGERCATICISEPDAGSDVGRIRTRGRRRPDGGWRITGEKIWISFGDHDMCERIGHCLLARTNDQPGTRGLSLFLVERGPGVTTQRIEEKLGLHGSPTCALAFADAPAMLIGKEGRGLAQLFTMIRHMRLTVACQGLGVALGAWHAAVAYASERRQGGDPARPAVPIAGHPDVRRQLLEMGSAIDLFRLALLETATAADLGEGDDDGDPARLCGLLLPLIKTFGAELAFDTANRAIQVLGGAGYTRDHPVEQALRDARVFAIYEGTTGIQAQDFLLRQCLADDGAALAILLDRARAECGSQALASLILDRFEAFMQTVAAQTDRRRLLAMAEPVMRAAWVAVQAWLAVRIAGTPEARLFLATAPRQLALQIARADVAATL